MVLWWIDNLVALAVIIPVVLLLATQLLRVATEISRYADDILVHGVGLTGTLDPLPALRDTQRLAGEAKANAVRYLHALERLA